MNDDGMKPFNAIWSGVLGIVLAIMGLHLLDALNSEVVDLGVGEVRCVRYADDFVIGQPLSEGLDCPAGAYPAAFDSNGERDDSLAFSRESAEQSLSMLWTITVKATRFLIWGGVLLSLILIACGGILLFFVTFRDDRPVVNDRYKNPRVVEPKKPPQLLVPQAGSRFLDSKFTEPGREPSISETLD